MDNEYTLHDITEEQLLKICLNSEFPGSQKYESDHPIWECRVGTTNMSPKEAWEDENSLKKAIRNLFKVYKWCVNHDKYHDFITRIDKACEDKSYLLLEQEVLKRFTIAKIAPKVTALHWRTMLRILEEANVDLSQYGGVYAPMAGFGGIIKAIKSYNKENKIDIPIEAYDINDRFCEYYGWEKRDVLAQKIKTDKIVIVCPPFGSTYENWNQKSEFEPEDMYSFKEWCDLIMEYVEAPNYIFIGPSERNSEKTGKQNGLFAKKVGIRWYPEYTYDRRK